VAWIVEHDDYPTEVELINELDHAPEIIGQEEARGWRFTPLYRVPQHETLPRQVLGHEGPST